MEASEEGMSMESKILLEINLEMQIFMLPDTLGISQQSSFILQMRRRNSRELHLQSFVGLNAVLVNPVHACMH